MEEVNFNETKVQETVESEKALNCDSNEPKKSKTPAMFKAGIALMCATSALSLGAIGACGFLGYKLYKNQKNQNSNPQDSMGSVVTNKGASISVSDDGYWVINGEKTQFKAEVADGEDGANGVSVVNASIVNLDKWGITTQIQFKMSDNSYIVTAPQTQIMSEHFYEAEDMSDILTLTEGYGISKIKLSKNVYLSASIDFSGDTIIDLNRKSLEYVAINPLKVAENSSLTFKNGSVTFKNSVGVSIQGENAELSFEKVTVSATSAVAETLENNASINLTNSTVQTVQAGYGASRAVSAGSLFIVKGENANFTVTGSKFETNKSIVTASENATEFKIVVKETKINTTAPILDINTDEVVPTLDIDNSTMQNSTVTELNTSPITSGSFNVDPTMLGATLEGVEQFNVNGSTVLAADLEALVDMVESGSTINLTKHEVLESNIVITKTLTINLGSYTISAPHNEDLAVLQVEGEGKLTINATEEGGINSASDSNDCSIAVWARNGGEVIINGGFYTNVGALSNLGNNKFANNEMIYTSGNGSKITINDGFFMGNFLNEKWGTRYTLNKHDSTDSEIVVNGGFFFGYNPAESLSEYPVENFVAENKIIAGFETSVPTFGFEGMVYAVASTSDFAEIVSSEIVSEITLNGNVVLERGIVIENRTFTLNLNSYSISAPTSASTALIRVNANGYLTIEGNGTINSASNANDYSIAVWASNGGQVTINGGTFTNVGAKDFEDNGVTPNNNELIYVSGTGSLITINNATIIGNSENKTWGTRYTLNKQDKCASEIVVNGGTFVSYDPSMSKSENPIANFVADGYFVYKVGNNYTVASTENLVDVINNNAGAEIMLPTAYVVDTTLTINLNGCTISTPNDTIGDGVFHVVAGGNLTINGEGTINGVGAGDYHMAIWVEGGKVTINGGTYTNVGATESGEPADQFDLMYVKGGELVINGGTFTSETPKWTLNLNDKIDGTITVNGGTFVGYNPASSETEPVEKESLVKTVSFVAEGNFVYKVGNNYKVASLENLVDVINNNAGAEIMLPTAYVVDTTLTINLNGCTISTPNDTIGDGVFHVVAGGNLTINGEGTINGVGAGNYHMAIWVEGGKATINGGTYTNIGATDFGVPGTQFDLMYVKGGELVINGGTFTSETPKWTLNLNDKIAGTITVYGGTFLGYNPTESHTENPVANFIADGYVAILEENNYTVVAE